MAKSDYCSCRYSHCLHPDQKRILKSEAVQDQPGYYYHPDCLETKQYIEATKKLYTEKFDANPIQSFLTKIINEIVFNKKVPAKKLYYMLLMAVNKNWHLHQPSGLYYVIKDLDLQKRASEYMAKQSLKQSHEKLVKPTEPIDEKPSFVRSDDKIVKFPASKTLGNFMD